MPRSVKWMPSVVVARRTLAMSWFVLPLNGAAVHCWDAGQRRRPGVVAVDDLLHLEHRHRRAGGGVGGGGEHGHDAVRVEEAHRVLDDDRRRPSPALFSSAVLIDLMSLLPDPVLLVFQMGNLLVDGAQLIACSGALSTTGRRPWDVGGVPVEHVEHLPGLPFPAPGSWMIAA